MCWAVRKMSQLDFVARSFANLPAQRRQRDPESAPGASVGEKMIQVFAIHAVRNHGRSGDLVHDRMTVTAAAGRATTLPACRAGSDHYFYC